MLDIQNLDPVTNRVLGECFAYIKGHYGTKTRRFSNQMAYAHPVEVCRIVANYTLNPNVLIAALLHDIVEDFEHINIEHVCELYGDCVAKIVLILTKPPKVAAESRLEHNIRYWNQITCSEEALLIKLADTLSNINSPGDSKEFKTRYLNEKSTSMLFLRESQHSQLVSIVEEQLKQQLLSLHS